MKVLSYEVVGDKYAVVTIFSKTSERMNNVRKLALQTAKQNGVRVVEDSETIFGYGTVKTLSYVIADRKVS